MTDDGVLLLRLAREAIETAFTDRDVAVPDLPWLHAPAAAFVTLRQRSDGDLRGCVGSIEARLPLGDAVVAAARSAAFRDPRFTRLSAAELTQVRIEVSVLSPLTPLAAMAEADTSRALEQTRPGVILRYGTHQGVLLPKVWSSVQSGVEFLRHLKLKADLAPAFWSERVELHVFTTHEFVESDERAHAATR
jgi:AmmeMemoRadiSam system protein A